MSNPAQEPIDTSDFTQAELDAIEADAEKFDYVISTGSRTRVIGSIVVIIGVILMAVWSLLGGGVVAILGALAVACGWLAKIAAILQSGMK